ncbi:hypothetical protein KA005_61910 [bacterium]|nr:hypothetical protein [bacterium]
MFEKFLAMFRWKWFQKAVYKLLRKDSFFRMVYVAALARSGFVPEGLMQGEVLKALKATKPTGVLEMMGFLKVRVFRHKKGAWEDFGLVSVKLVTTAFANFVVDALQNSVDNALSDFAWHDMGDDNTAEANTQTALSNSRETRIEGTQTENGAGIYQSVATINATGGYTVEEHGLFSAVTTGTMCDRNLVPNAPVVIADDSVEFTYELSVAAEAP